MCGADERKKSTNHLPKTVGNRFKRYRIGLPVYFKWRHRLSARTLDFHSGKRGSIPLDATTFELSVITQKQKLTGGGYRKLCF